MTEDNLKLEYFYDPFCGWCYASAPALASLAEAYPNALQLRPSGLFAGGGARRMASMADMAWRNDTRIAELTGQTFTTDYRDNVLRNPDAMFDSTYATRAIQALGELDSHLEPALLRNLQKARYIDGKDTSDASEVAVVAVRVAEAHGHAIDEVAFAARLTDDEALAARADARIGTTIRQMQSFAGSGVPQLLVTVGEHREIVQGGHLYGGKAAISAAIEAVKARAASAH